MLPTYVLITPARNEAEFIELTIQAVMSQTQRPLRWVIVSDGSTDGTDQIVCRYLEANPWIELVRTPERPDRHFAGKAWAFRAGQDRVRALTYDAIASLDADISFEADYFEFLLGRLASDTQLGVVGTPFKDTSMYDYRFVSTEHVSGACQLFRRECFDDIGGYKPVRSGGIDHIAVITARMKGWKTRTYTEKLCLHHRTIGTAEHGLVAAKFRAGRLDYALGSHPAWELLRSVYQCTRRPYFAGGVAILAGYVTAAIERDQRPVSTEFVRFRRDEQMRRLGKLLQAGPRQRTTQTDVDR